MIKFNISQSLMKDFAAYKNEQQCGLQLVAKYFDGQEFPSSDAMKLGQWFEFMCSGALPKNGQEPMPVRLKSGALSTDYERARLHVENYHKLIAHYRLTVLTAGKKIISGNNEGTIDLWSHSPEWGKTIVDLKYSGLLHDKWNELGWEAESLSEKEKTMLQAVHYKWLAKEYFQLDEYPEFFFAVFNSKNENDFKFFRINVQPEKLEEHGEVLRKAKITVRNEFNKGFKPHPDVKNCAECPLKDSCKYKITVPNITEIYY